MMAFEDETIHSVRSMDVSNEMETFFLLDEHYPGVGVIPWDGFFFMHPVYPLNPGHGPDSHNPMITNSLVIPENMVGPNISVNKLV